MQALRKHGVERFVPKEGDAFDHDLHNAMFDVPLPPNSEDMGPGSIAMLIKVRPGCWTRLHADLRTAHVGQRMCLLPQYPLPCVWLGRHIVNAVCAAQNGYSLNGRVVRPADVATFRAPA